MKQNEFEKLMLIWLKEEITVKQCVKNVILTLFFSLPLLIWKWRNFLWMFLGILPFALHLVTIIKLLENRKIKGVQCGLYQGMNVIFWSLILNISGIALVLYSFPGYWKFIIMIIWVICYIMMAVFYVFSTIRSIEKTQTSTKRTIGGVLGGAFGLLGFSTARIFMSELSNDVMIKILCFICFFLSVVFLLGVGNIVKFYYIKRFMKTDGVLFDKNEKE